MIKHKPGPKPGKLDKRNAKVVACYQAHSAEEAAKRFKISKASVYKIVREARAAQEGTSNE